MKTRIFLKEKFNCYLVGIFMNSSTFDGYKILEQTDKRLVLKNEILLLDLLRMTVLPSSLDCILYHDVCWWHDDHDHAFCDHAMGIGVCPHGKRFRRRHILDNRDDPWWKLAENDDHRQIQEYNRDQEPSNTQD